MSLTHRDLILCSVLAALVVAVYWPVRNYQFVGFDDPELVTQNPNVRSGVNWRSLSYALSASVAGNWHPVTTLSHEVDCEVFGLNPGWHHLVNVAFHTANALLLFLLFRRMTGAFWRSGIVAALFALHPLRVESVAWIAERKDVLSGFFFFLTLLLYAKYVEVSAVNGQLSTVNSAGSGTQATDRGQNQKSKIKNQKSSSARYYNLAVLTFALGLMSKPMLVTLPFVLLLVDLWPLDRFELKGQALKPRIIFPFVWEKWPFFTLSAISCWVTLRAQSGAVYNITLSDRVSNAIASCVKYLGKTTWPADMAILYPHPGLHYPVSDQWPVWQIGVAFLLLVAISAFCLSQLARLPWLAVGWFWYLGMMVPVIGLIQVGEQAMADRYTYLPVVGPVAALVWSVPVPRRLAGLGGLSLGLLVAVAAGACVLLTAKQLRYWQDTISLFEHTVEVTPDNPIAHCDLGCAYGIQGQRELAAVQYRIAIAINPRYLYAHLNLAGLATDMDLWPQAADHYLAVTRISPDSCLPHILLAKALSRLGRTKEAVFEMEEALRRYPQTPADQSEDPISGLTANALNDLAWFLATDERKEYRDGEHAVRFAEKACEITHYRETIMVGTLAAAYAEAGRFPEAVATAEKACVRASATGDPSLLSKNQELLGLYRAGTPYREPAPIPPSSDRALTTP